MRERTYKSDGAEHSVTIGKTTFSVNSFTDTQTSSTAEDLIVGLMKSKIANFSEEKTIMIPYKNSIIVPVDTGYGNIKNSQNSFPTGIVAYRTKPAFDEEFRFFSIAGIYFEYRFYFIFEINIDI